MNSRVEGDSVVARIKERWLMLLFALPFAGGGIVVLMFSLLPSLMEWQQMKSWEPIEAHLQSGGYRTKRSDDGSTYQAYATYTYSYQGQQYRGDRVAINGGSDNIGDFQQNLGRNLERAHRLNQPVTVWVDPAQPRQAVLNRELRFGLLALHSGFTLVFAGVGIGMWAFALLMPSDKLAVKASPDEPWKTHRPWASPTISSNSKAGVWAVWCFAIFWCLIAFPVGGLVVGEFNKGNAPALLGLMFPVVGLGLIAWAVHKTLAWRRFGETPLNMDPYPGAIGGQVGGTIDAHQPYDPSFLAKVTLSCLFSYVSGSGKNRSRKERLIWQTEGFAHTRSHQGHMQLVFLFDVEKGLPSSEKRSNRYHFWRLEAEAELPGVDFCRRYEIPVFPTEEKARHIRELSVEHTEAANYREREIESVINIRQIAGGVELYCPALRHWPGKLAGMGVGIVFFGAGVGIAMAEGFGLFPLIFLAIGAAAALGFLYSLLVTLRAKMDSQGIVTEKRILGLRVGGKTVPRSQVRKLRLKETSSSSVAYYKLQAQTTAQGEVDIAYNLAGRETAQHALEAVGTLTGYPV